MNKINFLISTFILLFIETILCAGGWTSGSGELIKDSHNPWFLNNTPSINFCIKIDEKNFEISQEFAKEQILKAVAYWKTEFSYAVLPSFAQFGPLKIATQEFNYLDCSEQNIDIRFQFGFLEPKQKEYLQDPKKFIAVSVRTDYSTQHLRGKGFVYFSPSKGPLAYNHKNTYQNAWSMDNGINLYLVIIHELGHVFGLSHTPGVLSGVMSESFPEVLLSKDFYGEVHLSPAEKIQYWHQNLHFFKLPTQLNESCFPDILLKVWAKVFNLTSNQKCITVHFKYDNSNQIFGKTTMEVFASEKLDGSRKLVASIELQMNRFNPNDVGTIWLPEEQKVFSQKELATSHFYINNRISGWSTFNISKSGVYNHRGNKKYILLVNFQQARYFTNIQVITPTGEVLTLL